MKFYLPPYPCISGTIIEVNHLIDAEIKLSLAMNCFRSDLKLFAFQNFSMKLKLYDSVQRVGHIEHFAVQRKTFDNDVFYIIVAT